MLLVCISYLVCLAPVEAGCVQTSSTSEFDDFLDMTGQFLPGQYLLTLTSSGVQPVPAYFGANTAPASVLWDDPEARHANLSPSVIKAFVEPLLEDNPYAAVVVAVASPYGTSTYGFGSARGPGSAPPNGDSFLKLGSISKTFTGAILAQAELEGRINMNVPAQLYMPLGIVLPTYNGNQITLSNLVTHTSGLPTHVDISGMSLPEAISVVHDPSWPQYVNTVNTAKLSSAPGTEYDYSNLGGALVGQALTNSFGQDYETLLSTKLLQPLGMSSTTSRPISDENSRTILGWMSAGEPALPAFKNPNGGVMDSAGSITSTGRDMAKFIQMNLGQGASGFGLVPILTHTPLVNIGRDMSASPVSAQTPASDSLMQVGIFWDVVSGEKYTTVGHGGDVFGFSSIILMNPSGGTGVFVSLNQSVSSASVVDVSGKILESQSLLTEYERSVLAR